MSDPKDPKSQRLAEMRTIISKPKRKATFPSLHWEVLLERQDGRRSGDVTAVRIVPRVHPKMPDQLRIAVERYRVLVLEGDREPHDDLFGQILRWQETSGEED